MVNKTEKSKYRPFLPRGHPIKSSKTKQVGTRRTTYSPTKTAAAGNMEKHKEESSPSEVIMVTASACFLLSFQYLCLQSEKRSCSVVSSS